MNAPIGKSVGNLCRRVIYACINGGVPLHLLDQIQAKVPELKNFFTSDDFDRICIDFSKLDSLPGDIENELEVPLFNLKNHLLHSASEANLNSLFWDIVFNQLFHSLNEASIGLNYRLESEWSSRTIFPKADDRFIDFVALMKVNEKEFPILLIEAGKETFDVENSHKDFSKLLGLMSASCISLAINLVEAKKSPELARVYGAWIGGTQIQFCIAHPVSTLTDLGTYQFHANLTFCPHWKYDILSTNNIPESEVSSCSCCLPISGEGFESLIAGTRIDTQTLTDESISLEVTEIDLDESIQETEAVVETVEALEGIETISEIPSTRTSTTALLPTNTESSDTDSKLFKGSISFDTLKRLKLFIKCVIDRIDLLSSTASDAFNDERKFDKLDEHQIFVKSRPSSLKETPESQKFDFSAKELQSSPLKRFTSRKKSLNELQIYWKLSTHDRIFPKLYNAELVNEFEVNFEFENMIPLVDTDAGFVCDLVFENRFFGSLVKCTTFAIHCLYSLYVLHESVGVIHSDISPFNIMHSALDNIWKLNDFEQSLEIEKSLSTPRTAGTQGYISPESRQTGLFTKESDVYSLGKVIQNVLYCIILRQFIEYRGLNHLMYEELISKFEHAMNRMCSNNSKQRSTVISALNEFYDIFEISVMGSEVDDLIIERVPFVIELEIKKKKDLENIEKELKTLELPKEFPEIKKPKFTSEDRFNITVENMLQKN